MNFGFWVSKNPYATSLKQKNKNKMRKLTDHKLNGLNDILDIDVLDEPGQGNANHVYSITAKTEQSAYPVGLADISFQNGPIKEFGVNGISNESLLAIVIDRLRGFQSGEYACEDNQIALESAEYCLNMLQKRTKDRLSRGVEGTNNK